MSGIYIPWMSMPETCDDCQVSADCPNDEHIDGYKMQERPRFCQLYPVPPHGRSIDADEFAKRMKNLVEKAENDGFDLGAAWYSAFVRHIELTPTIIPADQKEEQTVYDSLKTGLEQAVNGEYRTEAVTNEETE